MQASNRYLLDTNIASAYIKNDKTVLRRLTEDAVFHVSVATVGEMFYGAAHADNRARMLATVRAFLPLVIILPCDITTAELYGNIANHLRQNGQLIPVNDIWIAAHALQFGLTLVSRDSHFNRVVDLGLNLEAW